MAKTVIIETPKTELEMFNLTNEYNDMRASARKRAITAMFEERACSHGYILVGNAWYQFNGDKCVRIYHMDICEACHKEMEQEQATELEQTEAAPETSPEPDPETVKAYEQEHTYNIFISRAAANLDIPLDYFKSWQELGQKGQENFRQHAPELRLLQPKIIHATVKYCGKDIGNVSITVAETDNTAGHAIIDGRTRQVVFRVATQGIHKGETRWHCDDTN